MAASQQAPHDLSALLQHGTRNFTKLYERHAYRVYNLALRVTCEREAAMRAGERAFLGQVSRSAAEGELPAATVAAALAEARDGASGGGAGDAEAEELLAATVTLPPPQRAALALMGLHEADAEGIGKAMGLPAEKAAQLLERALAAFAERTGTDPGEAEQAYRAWLWAEPPQAMWESLYPRFYKTLERDLREGAPSHRRRRRAARVRATGMSSAARALRRLRRAPRLAAALILLLAAGGVAAARYSGGDSGTTEAQNVGGGQQPAQSPGSPSGKGSAPGSYQQLTPQEIDRLRRRELEQLREYSRRRRNPGLGRAQRDAAAKRERALVERARRRERAAALRERIARLRLQQLARERRALAEQEARRRSSSGGQQKGKDNSKTRRPSGSDPKNKQEADANCLFNENEGTYICPQ